MASSAVSLCILLALYIVLSPVVYGIGVNYEIDPLHNLPSPSQTISLLKWRNITKIRIVEPTPAILDALRNTNIAVYIGVDALDVQPLATDPIVAPKWVETNIAPYATEIVISGIVVKSTSYVYGDMLSQYAPGAMIRLYNALQAASIDVPVTTVVEDTVMGVSSPPSAGKFGSDSISIMKQICGFLQKHRYPILANIYPYFAYATNSSISVDHIFFNSTSPVVTDRGLQYFNIFDVMIDAMYTALEKAGAPSIDIVVSETGWPSWPSAGIDSANIDYAHLYIQNVINHVESGRGTPKRPNKKLETYIFCLYNVCQEPGGSLLYVGLYHPNQSEVFHIDFQGLPTFGNE